MSIYELLFKYRESPIDSVVMHRSIYYDLIKSKTNYYSFEIDSLRIAVYKRPVGLTMMRVMVTDYKMIAVMNYRNIYTFYEDEPSEYYTVDCNVFKYEPFMVETFSEEFLSRGYPEYIKYFCCAEIYCDSVTFNDFLTKNTKSAHL